MKLKIKTKKLKRIFEEITEKETHKIMKTIQEALDEFNILKTQLLTEIAENVTFRADVVAMINRLLATIQAGGDAQAIFDAIQPIKQAVSDESTAVATADAEVKLTGV